MPRKTVELLFPGGDPAGASMRPRPDAAENWRRGMASDLCRGCFNEAAARCRGKPQRIARCRTVVLRLQ